MNINLNRTLSHWLPRVSLLSCLVVLGVCLRATVLFAEPIVADDPAKVTDPDFKVQGEYLGEIKTENGPKKLGVQVIALGNHKFRAVGYMEGLPGEGWDLSEKHSADGETKDGVTLFNGITADAKIEDGAMSVLTKGGEVLGKLQRVARQSSTLGMKPPEGAIVLFDGKNADQFEKGRMTEDGLLMQGITSKQKFQSCRLHLEFRVPYQPEDSGQRRGNSGCYLQGRYEVQILDSFGLEGKNNECGGLYEIKDPDLNMCLPPLAWQSYDIDYTAAVYDGDGKKTKNALITVKHNGVVIHKNVELPKATRAAPVAEGPEPGPIYIQDHGNPVRFRNIWIVETK